MSSGGTTTFSEVVVPLVWGELFRDLPVIVGEGSGAHGQWEVVEAGNATA